MIPGQTRKPIEFIFGRYLPLDNSKPHPKGGPPPPLRVGVMEPEILGYMGRYRPTFSNRDEIWHEHTHYKGNMPAKFRPDRPPNGGVMGPTFPLGPIMAVCGLRPNGLADLVHFWRLPTPGVQQPPPLRGTPSSPQRGVMGPEISGCMGRYRAILRPSVRDNRDPWPEA